MARSSRRRGRTRLSVLLVAAFLGALTWTAGANATVWTYYGPAWDAYYGEANTSGWNYPDTNRVYRPLYFWFTIYYTDGSTAWGYKRNYWDNPLVWPYAGGYARSVCAHSDGGYPDPIQSVTCQYIT